MKYIIYGLIDPRTKVIRYIGKARTPQRINGHISSARQGKKQACACWIAKLLTLGIVPRLVILEECPPDTACDREKHWIATYRQEGWVLLNLTDGGEGAPGYKPTPETLKKLRTSHMGKIHTTKTRDKMSHSQRGKPHPTMKGRKQDPHTIQRRAESLKGGKRTPEQRKRMSNSRMGKPISEDQRAWQNRRTDQKLERVAAFRVMLDEFAGAQVVWHRARLYEAYTQACSIRNMKPYSSYAFYPLLVQCGWINISRKGLWRRLPQSPKE